MASLTPILETRLENPMVTGYGFAPAPVHLDPIEIAYCPRCHSKWVKMPEEMADDPRRPWETKVGSVWVTSPAYPVGRTYCRSCAIYAATCADLIDYVVERKLYRKAVEYAIICSREWENKIDPDWALPLWNMLKMKLYEDGILRGFIDEEHGEDFAYWMLGRSHA